LGYGRAPVGFLSRKLRWPQSPPGRMTQRSSRDEGIQQACTRLSGDEIFRIFCGSTCRHPPSKKNSMSPFSANRIFSRGTGRQSWPPQHEEPVTGSTRPVYLSWAKADEVQRLTIHAPTSALAA